MLTTNSWNLSKNQSRARSLQRWNQSKCMKLQAVSKSIHPS